MLNKSKNDKLIYHVLSVGNGEFTFIQVGSKAIVLDAGRGRTGQLDPNVKDWELPEYHEIKDNVNDILGGSVSSKKNDIQFNVDLLQRIRKATLEASKLWDKVDPETNRVWDQTEEGWDFIRNQFKKFGIKTIEAVFISHAHQDHTWLLAEMIQNMKVNNIIMPATNFKMTADHYVNDLKFKGQIWTTLQPIYKFLGIEFENLSASLKPKDLVELGNQNPNDASIVLRFNLFNKTILFTGDADLGIVNVDNGILLTKVAEKPVDVFVLPHHGSVISSVGPILDILGRQMKYGFISGTQSTPNWKFYSGGFKFPNPETITFLKQKAPSIRVFVTGALDQHPLDDDPLFYAQVNASNSSYQYIVTRVGQKHNYKYLDEVQINHDTMIKYIDVKTQQVLNSVNVAAALKEAKKAAKAKKAPRVKKIKIGKKAKEADPIVDSAPEDDSPVLVD